jgi:hypothetical protein
MSEARSRGMCAPVVSGALHVQVADIKSHRGATRCRALKAGLTLVRQQGMPFALEPICLDANVPEATETVHQFPLLAIIKHAFRPRQAGIPWQFPSCLGVCWVRIKCSVSNNRSTSSPRRT